MCGAGAITIQNPPTIDLGMHARPVRFVSDIAGGRPSSFKLCDGPVERTCACASVVLTGYGWLGSGAVTCIDIDRSEYKQSNG